MAKGDYETNLLRLIAAEAHSQLLLTTARDLFGKSYYALSAVEVRAVDRAVLDLAGSMYRQVTPEWLQGSAVSKVGFQGMDPQRQEEAAKTGTGTPEDLRPKE